MNSDEKKKTLRKRLSIAGNTAIALVTAVLVGFVAYTMICSAKGRTVSVFGRSMLKVVTGSMEPSLHTGDYIYIKKTPAEELEVGDVITFRSEAPDVRGKLVTHRIISIEPDGTFITKGDANPIQDKLPVRADQIVGKYTGKARFYHWIGSFADRKKLILILVMIPMSLMALYEVKTVSTITVEAMKQRAASAAEEKEQLIRDAIEKEKERLAQEALSEEELLAEKQRLDEAAENPVKEKVPEVEEPAAEEAPEVEKPAEEKAPEVEKPAEEEVPGVGKPAEEEVPEVEKTAEEETPEAEKSEKPPEPRKNTGNNSGKKSGKHKKSGSRKKNNSKRPGTR